MSNHTLVPITASSSNSLSRTILPSRLVALAAPSSVVHPRVLTALARHGMRGERLGMLIGDNRFELFSLTRLARRQGFDPEALLRQIELSRAFTCHQLHHRVMTIDETMAQRWRALFVLGLLDTFYDESVPAHEAAHLLRQVLERLQQLKCYGLDILVTAAPPKQSGREKLLELMAQKVDEYVEFYESIRTTGPRQFGPEVRGNEPNSIRQLGNHPIAPPPISLISWFPDFPALEKT